MTQTTQLINLISKFQVELNVDSICPFGNGHINDTLLVKTLPAGAPNYILQRKNHLIFKNVDAMMGNIALVTEHLRQKLTEKEIKDVDRRVMTYFPSQDGKMYVKDSDGNYWTLFLFIEDSCTVESIQNTEQAFQAARAFGEFQHLLADLPGNCLVETIPNFHNGLSRLSDFQIAIEKNAAGRVEQNQELIDQILSRADVMTRLQKWLDDGSLPLRITHNDTKINNILFDQNNQTLCVIDLDTVMPGSALYDFGDAIRSIGNTAPEDEPDLSKIAFNRSVYEAFAKGYLSSAGSFLTEMEIENLPFACRYMAWEQAMRFLTDYLNGDTYYKTEYTGHNLVRTKAQMRYLQVLEENRSVMEAVSRML